MDKKFKEASLKENDSNSGNRPEEELDKEPFEDDISVPTPPAFNKKLVVVLDSCDVNQGGIIGFKRPADRDETNMTSHPKMIKISPEGKGNASTMPVATLEHCETPATASNSGDTRMYPAGSLTPAALTPEHSSPISWSNVRQQQLTSSEPLCSTMVSDEQDHRNGTTGHHMQMESHSQGITRNVQLYSASTPSIYLNHAVNHGMPHTPQPHRPSTRIGQSSQPAVPWDQPEGRNLAMNGQNNFLAGHRNATGQQMHTDALYNYSDTTGQMQADSGTFSYPSAERANTHHQMTGQNAHGTQRPHAVGNVHDFQEDSRNPFRQQHQQTQHHQPQQHHPHHHQKHQQGLQHHNLESNAGRDQPQHPNREFQIEFQTPVRQHVNAAPTLPAFNAETGPSSGMEAIRQAFHDTHGLSDDLNGPIDLETLDDEGLVDQQRYLLTEMSSRSEENHNIGGPADLSMPRSQQSHFVDITAINSSSVAEGKFI